MSAELVKSVSLDNLLQQREAAVTRWQQAYDLMREAEQIGAEFGFGRPKVMLQAMHYKDHARSLDLDETRARMVRLIDAGGWDYLLRESGLLTFMDSAARDEWKARIQLLDVPALTRPNIEATFKSLYEGRAAMFDRGVVNVFRSLSWDYKTNEPRKFGERLILENMTYYCSGRGGLHNVSFDSSKTARLDDLTRVLMVIDGKPEPDSRSGWYGRLNGAQRDRRQDVEDDYLTVRYFIKGTVHVRFKRMDLVEELNKILARHHPNALAAAR